MEDDRRYFSYYESSSKHSYNGLIYKKKNSCKRARMRDDRKRE